MLKTPARGKKSRFQSEWNDIIPRNSSLTLLEQKKNIFRSSEPPFGEHAGRWWIGAGWSHQDRASGGAVYGWTTGLTACVLVKKSKIWPSWIFIFFFRLHILTKNKRELYFFIFTPVPFNNSNSNGNLLPGWLGTTSHYPNNTERIDKISLWSFKVTSNITVYFQRNRYLKKIIQ